MGLWSVHTCWHCHSVLLSRRTRHGLPLLHSGIPPTRDSLPLISPMLLSQNGFFHLVQKAHPHNRVEVSDLLLLNPVPAYTPENKASLQVLNSYWYSKQQSVLLPGRHFQVSGFSEVWFRFELSVSFSVRCIAVHSSQKKFLEHLACRVSLILTMEGDILAYRSSCVSLVCPIGTLRELQEWP